MTEDIELSVLKMKIEEPFDMKNSQSEHTDRQQVTAECEGQSSHDTGEATEEHHLLSAEQPQSNGVHSVQKVRTGSRRYVVEITLEKDPHVAQESVIPLLERNNGDCNAVDDPPDTPVHHGSAASCGYSQEGPGQQPVQEHEGNHSAHLDQGPSGYQAGVESGLRGNGCHSRLKRMVKPWMIIALVLLLIVITAVTLGLLLWAALYKDEDDTFQRDTFVVPLFYSGSLRLVNLNFTDNLLSPSSNQSQALSTQLEDKLSHVYSTSPALGRYFSGAGLYAFRNGSVTAYYWLKFLMPLDHEQLLHFTLSREMVYNVLRQHLYDLEPGSDLLYIDPSAIHMQVGNRTLIRD
ncbi:hypothetical protein COCON_G00188180 [Conger conger]|uniref:SEA domain-containing protein n=1 Tax=Conger conger TaxID=82655 RepID=A0A9Q1HQ41_CONCO|nr:uncharacterized protein LOC133107190 [Conger conger]KAJ8256666.1 hypothetical protein COCON_G00188180 [Conger conger]